MIGHYTVAYSVPFQVEQFVICDGDIEVSKIMQEEMIRSAEEFYQSLNIAYRVVNIVSGKVNPFFFHLLHKSLFTLPMIHGI